jgi:hypothetical protein
MQRAKRGRKRDQDRTWGTGVKGLESASLGLEEWRLSNCLQCRRSPEWVAGHGGHVDCRVGEQMVCEVDNVGFPREAAFRYVLGRSMGQGLKMGERWPAVCAGFERGAE